MDRATFMKQGLLLNFVFLICLTLAGVVASSTKLIIAPMILCLAAFGVACAWFYGKWFKSLGYRTLAVTLILISVVPLYFWSLGWGSDLMYSYVPVATNSALLGLNTSPNEVMQSVMTAVTMFPGLILFNWGLFTLLWLASYAPKAPATRAGGLSRRSRQLGQPI